MASISLTVTGLVILFVWLVAQASASRRSAASRALTGHDVSCVVYGRYHLRVAAGRFLFFLVTILISRALHARLRLASSFVWNCDLWVVRFGSRSHIRGLSLSRMKVNLPLVLCLFNAFFFLSLFYCRDFAPPSPEMQTAVIPYSLRYIIQTMDPTVPITFCLFSTNGFTSINHENCSWFHTTAYF